MEVFEIVPASDERTRVPFRVPVGGGHHVEFSIPRLQFLTEDKAREMKEALQALDKFVQQVDMQGELLWEYDETGQHKIVDGEKVPLMGPPQRTVNERTRAITTAMLGCVVEPDVFERLKRLTVGELDQIVNHWTKASEEPLDGTTTGESSASSSS